MSSLNEMGGPRIRRLVDESDPYETIAVEKLTPIIGAEISGVDIGELVSGDARPNRQMDEIHRALAENLVIFFRDQHITPQQHLAFGRRFGDLHIHPAAPHHPDDPHLFAERAEANSRPLPFGDRALGSGCAIRDPHDPEPGAGLHRPAQVRRGRPREGFGTGADDRPALTANPREARADLGVGVGDIAHPERTQRPVSSSS